MAAPTEPPRDSFWDSAYRNGDHRDHWEPPEVPPELREAVRSGTVRRGQSALDIGCGAGAEAVFLAGAGVTVIAVDSSSVALELARRRAADARVEVDWRQGDATRLPVRDNAVDFAFDRGCLHVIARRRRRAYAREVARVLRPGGRFLLRGARDDDDELGVVGISRREVDRLFVCRGFECITFTPLAIRARSGDLAGVQVLLESRSQSRFRGPA